MEDFAEWTFEGGHELTVGVTGNRTRYQSGMYDSYMNEWTIRQYEWYRDNKILLPSQA